MSEFVLFIPAWIGIGSLVAYAAMAWDKFQARRGGWRVSERSLLFLAVLGGWPGTKVAQHRLRHKTRKQPFGWLLNALILINVGVVVTLFYPDLWDWVLEFVP